VARVTIKWQQEKELRHEDKAVQKRLLLKSGGVQLSCRSSER